MNTDGDSEATFNSNVRDSMVFLFSPRLPSPSSRKLCANGTKLTLGADYVACKIKRLQLYCVIFIAVGCLKSPRLPTSYFVFVRSREGKGERTAPFVVLGVWCLRNTAAHNQWTRPTRTRAPHSYRTRALMRDP